MTTFSYTGSIQTFTATNGGTYKIVAYGAQGGYSVKSGGVIVSGGYGAEIGGYFTLSAHETLKIVVGGNGANSTVGGSGGGGGGGSFVIETFDGTTTIRQVLEIAGGGGGSGYGQRGSGSAGGAASANRVNNGAAGAGGADDSGGGGGGYKGGSSGGYNVSTQTTTPAHSGYAAGQGYAGGDVSNANYGKGGYGGGGGGGYGGGGGGGVGGGAGGTGGDGSGLGTGVYGGGGGGGSVDNGGDPIADDTLSGENGLPGKYNVKSANGLVVITAPVCFLRGTQILTPTGPVGVETLCIGDPVVTRFGGIQTIKWIGRQSYPAAAVQGDAEKIPVCIHAGALGDMLPARDLYISPGHSMLVDGNLLLGSVLVNGVTVTQDWAPPQIDYFHLELPAHDCVVAEGAWSETYSDAHIMRQRFHNAAEFDELYPDNGAPPEEFTLCAPRPERGVKLDLALRSVAARCADQVTPGTLRGSIDLIVGSWTIYGWAQDLAHPDMPVLMEIVLEGRVVGTALACDLREDLQAAGIGRGRAGFCFVSPVRLRPEALATLRIRRASDGAELAMAPSCCATIVTMPPSAARQGLRLVARA